jgi:DNA-directed RNA polymerase subunit RPC12/RpoP
MTENNFNIDINQTTELTCESCGHNHFEQVFMIRKLSPLLSPTGQPALIPIPVYACTKCGTTLILNSYQKIYDPIRLPKNSSQQTKKLGGF